MEPETEDWFTEKCRDPEFVKAYLEEQRKMGADDLRDAVEAETERIVRVVAAFTKLSGSRKSALIAEICGDAAAIRVGGKREKS